MVDLQEVLTLLLALLLLWIALNALWRLRVLSRLIPGAELRYGVLLVAKKPGKATPKKTTSIRLLGLVGGLLYLLALALSLYALLATAAKSIHTGERGVVVLIPGLNVVGEDLLYFLVAVFIAVSLHEYLHAKIALKAGVPVKSWGIMLALIIPAAFIEVDEEVFEKASKAAKVAILSMGIAANLALALLSAQIAQFIVQPGGFVITSIENGSLADRYGLKPHDVVYYINGTSATIDALRTFLNNTEPAVLVLQIYRPGEGLKEVVVYKGRNETRLGVTLIPLAPNERVVWLIGTLWFIHVFKALMWIYVVNFGLILINALPLFITDGGRIVDILLGPKASKAVNAIALALLLLVLVFSGRL